MINVPTYTRKKSLQILQRENDIKIVQFHYAYVDNSFHIKQKENTKNLINISKIPTYKTSNCLNVKIQKIYRNCLLLYICWFFLIFFEFDKLNTIEILKISLNGGGIFLKILKYFKIYNVALATVAQWTERQPVNWRVHGSIPGQGTCLGCRPGPQLEVCERQPINISLPPFLPPSPSPQINK